MANTPLLMLTQINNSGDQINYNHYITQIINNPHPRIAMHKSLKNSSIIIPSEKRENQTLRLLIICPPIMPNKVHCMQTNCELKKSQKTHTHELKCTNLTSQASSLYQKGNSNVISSTNKKNFQVK